MLWKAVAVRLGTVVVLSALACYGQANQGENPNFGWPAGVYYPPAVVPCGREVFLSRVLAFDKVWARRSGTDWERIRKSASTLFQMRRIVGRRPIPHAAEMDRFHVLWKQFSNRFLGCLERSRVCNPRKGSLDVSDWEKLRLAAGPFFALEPKKSHRPLTSLLNGSR